MELHDRADTHRHDEATTLKTYGPLIGARRAPGSVRPSGSMSATSCRATEGSRRRNSWSCSSSGARLRRDRHTAARAVTEAALARPLEHDPSGSSGDPARRGPRKPGHVSVWRIGQDASGHEHRSRARIGRNRPEPAGISAGQHEAWPERLGESPVRAFGGPPGHPGGSNRVPSRGRRAGMVLRPTSHCPLDHAPPTVPGSLDARPTTEGAA